MKTGSKYINKQGYVMVKVSKDHHLRDKSGYAREHRIIAEKKIGRRLLPEEEVHHIDFDRSNNLPDNLLVCSRKEHRSFHRSGNYNMKMPNETNVQIFCKCGCGEKLWKYDKRNYERKYIDRHSSRNRRFIKTTSRLSILQIMNKDMSVAGISRLTGLKEGAIYSCLYGLIKHGYISKINRGKFRRIKK